METSPEIGKLASALSKTQGMMKAAQLDGTNPFFNSRYSTLAAIIEASRNALAANELAIVQGVSTEGDPLVVKISTMLVHSSNQWIRETLTVRPAKVGIHELASAITYARRIAMGSLLAIYADDDDGNLAAEPPVPTTNVTPIRKAKESSGSAKEKPAVEGSSAKPATRGAEKKQNEPNQPENAHDKQEKTALPEPKKISERAAKIREIFTLSGQLGQNPVEMKQSIGEILNQGGPIADSSQIKSEELDQIITAFKSMLAEKELANRKEAA